MRTPSIQGLCTSNPVVWCKIWWSLSGIPRALFHSLSACPSIYTHLWEELCGRVSCVKSVCFALPGSVPVTSIRLQVPSPLVFTDLQQWCDTTIFTSEWMPNNVVDDITGCPPLHEIYDFILYHGYFFRNYWQKWNFIWTNSLLTVLDVAVSAQMIVLTGLEVDDCCNSCKCMGGIAHCESLWSWILRLLFA